MIRFVTLLGVAVAVVAFGGCAGTVHREQAPSNHREAQATRQLERDLDEAQKQQTRTKQPLDAHSPDRQGIIDQPR